MWPFSSFVYISVIQIWDFTFSLETWIQSLSYILDWTYLSCCYLVYITPRRSFHHNRYLSRPRGLGSFSYTAVKERFLSFEHFLLHKHIQIVSTCNNLRGSYQITRFLPRLLSKVNSFGQLVIEKKQFTTFHTFDH